MQLTAVVESISPLSQRTYKDSHGQQQIFEYADLVLNNGIEKFACRTASGNLAKRMLADGDGKINKGDLVNAIIVTQCYEAKTQTGETFLTNRTELHHIQKFPLKLAYNGF